MKTELEKILSVAGKPGLYKVVNGGRATIIAESLLDGKKQPIHSTQRVSSLADISIYTLEEDVPLRDVLIRIREHYKGAAGPDHKAEGGALRRAIKEVLPTYDEERVYDSDLRKLFHWYNILQSREMLDFAEPVGEEEGEDESSAS